MSLFKSTALEAVTDIARELSGTPDVDENDQQRLFNATLAALSLGATDTEVDAALDEGWPIA